MDVSNILYFSTYPPRECGIATFTRDLTKAMDKKFNPSLKSEILAVNDNGSSIYNYGKNVGMQLDEEDIEKYVDIAEKINNDDRIKLVNVQHEFGIFGGDHGEFLIPFLQKLEKPVVVTFHSIVPNPDKKRLRVVQVIAKRSSAIIVMANTAVKILGKVYGVDTSKIYVIHHGVPSVGFLKDNTSIKELLNLKNRIVISTFGLINRGKGIEYVIKALPELVKKYPNLLYLVIGETHPTIRKKEGESYRTELTRLVKDLGLRNNVKFYNKYLNLDEIITYLKATDIYVYSALDINQIVSGTLAYALGAGKAIIATPSLYAKEMLQDERGIVVGLKDYKSMRNALDCILSDNQLKETLEKNAYKFSRNMVWQNVAARHLEVFKKIVHVSENIGMYKLPKIKLSHLLTLTDDTGVIQHAKHSLPNRFAGYCVDDNARALIAATSYYNKSKNERVLKLVNTYLSFLHYAQREDGYFRDSMSYDKRFIDEISSEDAFGRALWACGFFVNSKVHDNLKDTAKFIFDNALNNLDNIGSLRAQAFSLIGMCSYYRKYNDKNIFEKIVNVANKLVERYDHCNSEEWKWFEDSLTYSNGKIPEALFLAYDITKDEKYLKVAEEALGFLTSLVILNKKLVLIGHKGWYKREGKRAFYDQQPVNASSMVEAYMTAYEVTGKKDYHEKAVLSYNWFLGRNSLGQTIYDEATGGCYDGLLPDCVNLNQGAESTVCHLLARLRF